MLNVGQTGIEPLPLRTFAAAEYSGVVAKYFPMLQCDRPANEKLVAVGGEATERGQFRIRPTTAPQFH